MHFFGFWYCRQFVNAFVSCGNGRLGCTIFLAFFKGTPWNGSDCSVAKAGVPVSLPVYFLIQFIYVIIKRIGRVSNLNHFVTERFAYFYEYE